MYNEKYYFHSYWQSKYLYSNYVGRHYWPCCSGLVVIFIPNIAKGRMFIEQYDEYVFVQSLGLIRPNHIQDKSATIQIGEHTRPQQTNIRCKIH